MLRTLLLAAVAARGACVSVPPAPTTAVFGHKIPDTDAICAALAYEWELEARGMPARAYRLGELNRETEYVLNALGVDVPPLLDGTLEPGAPVAIVDTNNPGELPEGIENAAVHSVIDHHKLTGLRTVAPLEVDMRPLCSAGSIIYARAKAAGRSVPKRIAGLLLSCILSDSLEFRSPTTTPEGARHPRPAPTPLMLLSLRRHRGIQFVCRPLERAQTASTPRSSQPSPASTCTRTRRPCSTPRSALPLPAGRTEGAGTHRCAACCAHRRNLAASRPRSSLRWTRKLTRSAGARCVSPS